MKRAVPFDNGKNIVGDNSMASARERCCCGGFSRPFVANKCNGMVPKRYRAGVEARHTTESEQ
jgi:hypothetical protein